MTLKTLLFQMMFNENRLAEQKTFQGKNNKKYLVKILSTAFTISTKIHMGEETA